MKLFSVVPSGTTRDNGHRTKCKQFHLNSRKQLFTLRVINYWHRLPKQVVESPSVMYFLACTNMKKIKTSKIQEWFVKSKLPYSDSLTS